MTPTLPIRVVRPTACASCPELSHCGGPDGRSELDTAGCWDRCVHPDGCRTTKCRWTCPFNEPIYTRRLLDVGGSLAPIYPRLLPVPAGSLPLYVPRLLTGVRAALKRPLQLPFVSISLYEAVGFIRRSPNIDGNLRDRFRAHYGLGPQARVLLLGVARDSSLEGYWHIHQDGQMMEGLRQLDPVGVTVPDFSFFTDVPRTDSMLNRRRMLLVAQRLSEAGICVVPHFNAGNDFDWMVWAELLRRNQSVTMFAKEFQTGHRKREQTEAAATAILKLRDAVGRPLHPVLVSGLKAVNLLAPHFDSLTVLDAMPCFKALKCKRFHPEATVRRQWEPSAESPADCLAGLIEANVAGYAGKVRARVDQSRMRPERRSNLRNSWEATLRPRRTNQPFAFGQAPWKSEATEVDQLSMFTQPLSLTS